MNQHQTLIEANDTSSQPTRNLRVFGIFGNSQKRILSVISVIVTLLSVVLSQPAEAARPRDWCGTIWSLEANPFAAPFNLAWVSKTGVSSTAAPNSNISMPTTSLPSGAGGAAALGIHTAAERRCAIHRSGILGATQPDAGR
jgi:hypothetical protein